MANEKRLIALVGPSGSGKTAILEFLTSFYPDDFAVPRSATSRPRREGEGDGEFDFVSEDGFDVLIKAGSLLEYSTYAGHRYGVTKASVDEIIKQGRCALRAMDFPGAKASGAYSVFVKRDTDKLLDALLERNLPDADTVRRLRQLKDEQANQDLCDAVIVNDAAIRDAAFQVYRAITGKDGRVIPATFAVIEPDGSIARAPCHVDLAWDTVAFDDKRPEISDGDERLFIGGKMLDVRRTPFENGIDKIELSV